MGSVLRTSGSTTGPTSGSAWPAWRALPMAGTPDPVRLAKLQEMGDDAMPGLHGAGALRWLKTRGDLKQTASGLGLPKHFYFAVPSDGFSLGQYALAKMAHASPVAGAE